MREGVKLVRVYTGSEISVLLLKGELENIGVSALIKNDFSSGIAAGFAGGVHSAIDLYIHESDFNEAEPFIQEFVRQNG
ncbi:putative signal transducing protein [Gaoshiqia sp. Z1-71]|uniref:putative signal transducing protein n=1 Tax=Gaoshiqia hydrogeniformans TaxID=3290090 RepID=UPI003BF7C5D9